MVQDDINRRSGGLAGERQRGWNENSFQTALAYRSGCTTSTGRTARCCRRRGTRAWRRATACRCWFGPPRPLGEPRFADAAHKAFESMRLDVVGGWRAGRPTIAVAPGSRSTSVDPPSHILNGFIWALWGVYDYARWSGSQEARRLFECLRRAPLKPPCPTTTPGAGRCTSCRRVAVGCSPAGTITSFTSSSSESSSVSRVSRRSDLCRRRWQRYLDDPVNRTRALVEKAAFKLLHY